MATKPSRRRMRLASFAALPVLAGLAVAPAAAQVRPDPLQAAFNAAIASPENVPLQLAYARAAEGAGKYEAAFPVYERVLALDPRNSEAKAGLARIRAILQPSRFDTSVEVGGNYETNPLRVPPGAGENGEFQFYANLNAKYEATAAMHRWRTEARLAGLWHAEQDQLNYAYAGFITGPVVDLSANALLHIAGGAGISSFSGRLFYTEALASLTAESGYAGAQQTLRLRAAWRQYDPFWVSDSGFWADITAKFIKPQPQPGAAFIFTPYARISAVGGSVITGFIDPIEVTPGAYIEGGGQVQYVREIRRNVSGALSLTLNQRRYSTDLVPVTLEARRDFTATPGVSLVWSDIGGTQADLRLRYQFVWNDSNDNAHDFRTQVFTLGVGRKF